MTNWDDDDTGARGAMRSRRRQGRRCKVAPWPQVPPRMMIVWLSFVPVMLYGLYLIGAPFH